MLNKIKTILEKNGVECQIYTRIYKLHPEFDYDYIECTYEGIIFEISFEQNNLRMCSFLDEKKYLLNRKLTLELENESFLEYSIIYIVNYFINNIYNKTK